MALIGLETMPATISKKTFKPLVVYIEFGSVLQTSRTKNSQERGPFWARNHARNYLKKTSKPLSKSAENNFAF